MCKHFMLLCLTIGLTWAQLEHGALTAPSGRFERTRNQAVPPLEEQQAPVVVPEIIPVNEIIEEAEIEQEHQYKLNNRLAETTTERHRWSWRDGKDKTRAATTTTTTTTTTHKPWEPREIPVHEVIEDDISEDIAITTAATTTTTEANHKRWQWHNERKDRTTTTTTSAANEALEPTTTERGKRISWSWSDAKTTRHSVDTTAAKSRALPTLTPHPTRRPTSSSRWNSYQAAEVKSTTTTTKTPTITSAKPEKKLPSWLEREQQRRELEKKQLQQDKQRREQRRNKKNY